MLGNGDKSNLEQSGDGVNSEEYTGPRSRFRSAAELREEDSGEDSGSELDTTNDEDGEGEGEGEKDEGSVARRLDGELEAAGLGLPSTLVRQESTGGDDDLDAVAVQAPAAASMLGFSGFESVATFRVFLAALADNGVNLENIGLTTDEDTGRTIITIFAGAESNDELNQRIGKLLKQAKKDSEFNAGFQQLQVLEGDLPEGMTGVGVDALATPHARSVEEFITAAFADGEGGSGEGEGEGEGADDEERGPALAAASTKKTEDDGSEDESSCASAVAACITRTFRARKAVEAAGATVWWLGEEAVGGFAARLGDAGAAIRSILPGAAGNKTKEDREGSGDAKDGEASLLPPENDRLIADFKHSKEFGGFLTALEGLGVSAEDVAVIINETNGRLDIVINTPRGITLDADEIGVMIGDAGFGRDFNEVHIHPAVALDEPARADADEEEDLGKGEEGDRVDEEEGPGNGEEGGGEDEEGGIRAVNDQQQAVPAPSTSPIPAAVSAFPSATPSAYVVNVTFAATGHQANETLDGNNHVEEAPIIGASWLVGGSSY